jgi:hypothetical protein
VYQLHIWEYLAQRGGVSDIVRRMIHPYRRVRSAHLLTVLSDEPIEQSRVGLGRTIMKGTVIIEIPELESPVTSDCIQDSRQASDLLNLPMRLDNFYFEL